VLKKKKKTNKDIFKRGKITFLDYIKLREEIIILQNWFYKINVFIFQLQKRLFCWTVGFCQHISLNTY